MTVLISQSCHEKKTKEQLKNINHPQDNRFYSTSRETGPHYSWSIIELFDQS